jgi:hypothetical protein
MVCGDLADLSPGENSYDIITFWHSLEHMIRFRENLLQAHKSLTTSGYLFIAVPNPASFEVKIYNRNWVAYDAPRHLWHFRPLVMQRILRVYGFKVIKTIAMPLDPFYNCLLSEGLEKRRGIKLFRYFVRFPMVVGLSFFLGLVNPQKGSSVIYVCNRHQASDLRP